MPRLRPPDEGGPLLRGPGRLGEKSTPQSDGSAQPTVGEDGPNAPGHPEQPTDDQSQGLRWAERRLPTMMTRPWAAG